LPAGAAPHPTARAGSACPAPAPMPRVREEGPHRCHRRGVPAYPDSPCVLLSARPSGVLPGARPDGRPSDTPYCAPAAP